MKPLQELINCSAASIFSAPRLRKWLGLAHDPTYFTPLGLIGQVLAYVSDSRKLTFKVQCMEHQPLVEEPKCASCAHAGLRCDLGTFFVPVQQSWRWLAMWSTCGSANPRGSGSSDGGPGRPLGMPRHVTESIARELECFKGDSSIPAIPILRPTALDDLLPSEQIVGKLFLRAGDRTWLLRVTVEGTTDGECDRPQGQDRQAQNRGGSCGRGKSTWKPAMTATIVLATGLDRHFASGYRSEPNWIQIGSPGDQ